MPDWENVTDQKEWFMADLHQGLQLPPHRERDLMAFMRLYLHEATTNGQSEMLDFYLCNLMSCANHQGYDSPYSYTHEDCTTIDTVLENYLEAMQKGCEFDDAEQLGDQLINTIPQLDSQPGKRIMNEWRREALQELTNMATEYADFVHNQRPDFDADFTGPQEMGGM